MMKLKRIFSFLLTIIIFASVCNVFSTSALAADWILRTSTILGQTQRNFDFAFGNYNNDQILDLYAIKKYETSSKKTEVHIFNGHNNYQTPILQTPTILEMAENNFDFAVGDYDLDGAADLYAIKKYGTSSKKTEVHILNGADNFQSFILQVAIPLNEAKDNFDFTVADYDKDGVLDLCAIKKSNTGSNMTEVHIVSGAKNYQEFLLQTSTALSAEGEIFDFKMGDYNADTIIDLIAIKKYNTGSSSTEIHILNGHNNYQTFLLQTGTPLLEAKDNYDFEIEDIDSDGKIDFCAIKKNNTGSKTVELHIMEIQGAKEMIDAREKEITSILRSMMNGTSYNEVYKLNSKYEGQYKEYECKGFARDVFEQLFNISIGKTGNRDKKLNYQIEYDEAKTKCVGSVTEMSEDSVKKLFIQARPGDFVQMRRRGHGGSHSAIVFSVSDTEIVFFEANLDGDNGIEKRTYTWGDLCKSNVAMSLYTAIDY